MVKEADSKNTEGPKEKGPDFYVAAIGASAGGLDPLKRIFSGIQPGSGIAYVVISHLDPHHSSMLPQLIQKTAKLEVKEIADGMEIKPDTIYVIAPNSELRLQDCRFHVEERSTDKMPFPINAFLASLAEQCADFAIAVILSGTGTDGTAGIKAVKEKMGIVLAQDPETAQYRGMPLAAIATRVVDQVMDPDKMGPYMAEYVATRKKRQMTPDLEKTIAAGKLNTICTLLHRRTGHDFSGYKQNTIIRRILRRMDLHRTTDIEDYIRFLQERPEEADALFGELLIGVTNFFRDPSAWEIIKEKVFPIICRDKEPGADIRVWVPGVSTGEEAYTMAMLFYEYMAEQNTVFKLTIFGTDIDDSAVDKARKGVYPSAVAADISKERLDRFFIQQSNAYVVNRDIRESIIFAPQNLLKDPPFSRLDLICCRNVLIYMNSTLQKRLIPLFYYALNPNGVLFLGSSESISNFSDLFTTVDTRWKIYRRAEGTRPRAALEFPVQSRAEAPAAGEKANAALIIGQRLLEEFVPSCVVIDQDGRIQYIHGRTGKYLEPASGEAQWDIYRMAREGLKNNLSAAVQQSISQNVPISRTHVKVRTNGDSVLINLHVKPLVAQKDGRKLLMVAFEEIKEPREADAAKQTTLSDRTVDELELELRNTRENLQSTVEELETSNEELRSMNEEYQSTNEELKSANEELETSREELQSLNEELTTVNSELQEKINGLNEVQKETQIFLDSLDIPTVFLDQELRIMRFTMQASAMFHIIESDIGRPIQHFASVLNDDTFVRDAEDVLKNLRYKEREVQTRDGHWFLRRTLPYRTDVSKIRGIAVNYVDINSFKTASGELKKVETIVGSITDIVQEPLLVLDSQHKVMRASDSFYKQFNLTPKECIGQSFSTLFARRMDVKVIQDYFEVLQQGKKIQSITSSITFGTRKVQMIIHAQKVAYGVNYIWCVAFQIAEPGEKIA